MWVGNKYVRNQEDLRKEKEDLETYGFVDMSPAFEEMQRILDARRGEVAELLHEQLSGLYKRIEELESKVNKPWYKFWK